MCCILVSHRVHFPKLMQAGGQHHYAIIYFQLKQVVSNFKTVNQLNDICHVHIAVYRIKFVAAHTLTC